MLSRGGESIGVMGSANALYGGRGVAEGGGESRSGPRDRAPKFDDLNPATQQRVGFVGQITVRTPRRTRKLQSARLRRGELHGNFSLA
jgi:hypothetical protein